MSPPPYVYKEKGRLLQCLAAYSLDNTVSSGLYRRKEWMKLSGGWFCGAKLITASPYTDIVYSKYNYATSLCKALMCARMICSFVQKLTSIATCPKNHVLELIVGQGQYVST